MKMSLSTSVVICTLNRPTDLARLLKSIVKQSVLPKEVIVVDQSDNTLSKGVVEKFAHEHQGRLAFKHAPGHFRSLTKGRNLGVSQVRTPVTTFLDDDVEIAPNYLQRVLEFFEKDKGLVIGGVPWSADGDRHLPRPGKAWNLYRKLFGLGSITPGEWKVLPCFEGTFDPDIKGPTLSQWISGSNFSTRTDIARKLKFDDGLQGYCIGEDLDFPLRVLNERANSVVIDPTLPVVHHSSEVARLDSDRLMMMRACHHYYLFWKHWGDEPAKYPAFVLSRIGFVLMPSLQWRIAQLIPHPKALFRALSTELKVIMAFNKVRRGQFIYRL